MSDLSLKDALLAEIRKSKGVFYNTVVAQAQRIEVTAGSGDVHVLGGTADVARDVRAERGWLESICAAGLRPQDCRGERAERRRLQPRRPRTRRRAPTERRR